MIIKIILFLSIGFILFLIEMLTPGFGLTGIIGLLFLIIGCYLSYTKLNFFAGLAVSILSLILVILFFKLFPKSIVWKKIRLDLNLDKEKGFVSVENLSKFLGKEGITLTVLKPTGIAKIDQQKIDVVSKEPFIDKDKKIKVIEVIGNKVIVEEVK